MKFGPVIEDTLSNLHSTVGVNWTTVNPLSIPLICQEHKERILADVGQ